MKCGVLCFIPIGFWSVMPLVQGGTFEYECDILQRLDNLENTNKETKQLLVSQEVMLNTANTLIVAQESKFVAQESKIAALESKIGAQESMIATLEIKDNEKDQLLANLTNKVTKLEGSNKTSTEKLQGQPVGFTMKVPIVSPASGQLIFGTTVSNVGGGYNVTTGVFTCSIPGYYYFFASLLKVWIWENSVYCSIYTNNVSLVKAHTHTSESTISGHYAAVNSVYVHLDAGDNVTLAGCSPIASFHGFSTFSGFLVTADVI